MHDIKNYLNSPELAQVVIAGDILRSPFPVVPPEATLSEALDRFLHHDGERLPVVSSSSTQQLLGSVSKTDLILALAGSNRSATARVADGQ